ncbi:hypothetical protein [Sphingobacterium sp. E70]|uniref:hypothetical protein n=1 Tax=Sphingobacterium sp. E70 TaxID=2853439 RepID=UPI00359C5F61
MAGTGDDGIQVVNGTIFKDQFEQLVAINKEKKYLPEVKVRGPMNRSDHYLFMRRSSVIFIYTLGASLPITIFMIAMKHYLLHDLMSMCG